jgi:cytochrome-b5 reductase
VRPYTPTTLESESEHSFQLVIKKYDTGALTPYLFGLKAGDKISIKGPIEKYPLAAKMLSKEDEFSHICMIAGGTGITPMLQIIKECLSKPYSEAPVVLRLIFANQSEKDILLKEEIDKLVDGKRFIVEYTVDKSFNPTWKGKVGFVDKQMIGRMFPYPGLGKSIKIFVCGPPGFVKHVCGSKAPDYSQGELDGLLKEMGYEKDQVFKF